MQAWVRRIPLWVAAFALGGAFGSDEAKAGPDQTHVYAIEGIVCESDDYGVSVWDDASASSANRDDLCVFPAKDVKISIRLGGREIYTTRTGPTGRFTLPDHRESSDEDACIRFEAEGVNPYTTCYGSLAKKGLIVPGRNKVRVEVLSPVFDYIEFSPSREHGPPLDAEIDPWTADKEVLRGFLQANFDALDVLDINGEKITPSSLAGKWVLIEFWATWCGFCRKEIPHLREAYEEFKNRPVEMIGISLDEVDSGAFRLWIDKQKISWRQVLGEDAKKHPLGDVFRVAGLPRSFLVDPNGLVVGADLRSWRVKHELKRRLGLK